MPATSELQHVNHAWDDADAAKFSPVERLVYRSNILGDDQRITNTGGGNTSSKLLERDPLTGDEVEVLWVKGSGGDLRTAKVANFASLYQGRVTGLRPLYEDDPNRGLKTPAEDRMVSYYPHCTFNLNPRASSIDTPLHAFVPAKHVDHMHPNAVISIAASRRGEELTRDVFGGDVGWLPWMRPGFELGLALGDLCREQPELKGAMLGQHGIINWADDDRECYELTLDLIERAARYIADRDRGDDTFGGARCESLAEAERRALLIGILPWLRGRVSQQRRFIGTVQCDASMLRFVNSADAPRLAELGTSCPDHFLRTKIKPLYIDWHPQQDDVGALRERLDAGIAEYREDYAAYYERCRRDDSPAMRDPNPTVILIPGVGMIAWGKSKSESRVTAEFYNCAVEVMRGAEAIDEYIALPQQEAFDIEYWALEEAKLRRMPPEQEFARRVAVVIGAGSGIGREAALGAVDRGAHVVCADLNGDAAESVANEITDQHGPGIGVAGTDGSDCGPCIAHPVDVTDPDALRGLIERTLLAYGGIDHLVITSGVYIPQSGDRANAADWRKSFDVNVTGIAAALDAMRDVWNAQGMEGSAVITTSVNAVVPKAGSFAYDTSKAAANHLVREYALALAPEIRVNAVAPATVVAGSSMFPRERVITSLQKYGIDFDESESTESLRDRLAGFYAERTLLKQPIRVRDQVEAILFLLGDGAARTTGQVLNVDGGLSDAFLR